MNEIILKLKKIEPDLIIRDSVDLYGMCAAKKLDIPIVSFITNNLYNWEYFENNPKDWHIFFGTLDIVKYLPANYYTNFRTLIEKLYNKFELEYDAVAIVPYHNFNITDRVNIIFSPDFLQPQESLKHINSFILNPSIKKYSIEKNIPKKLIDFLALKHKKLIYLSTGSFINQEMPFYYHTIKQMYFFGYSLIISGGKYTKQINEYISLNHLSDKVYCDKFLPQNYILSIADAFISAGGFNSILESIYYETPMIIRPITCEQRMNGLFIEKIGVGVTQYGRKKRNMYDEFKIIFSPYVSDKLKEYSRKLKSYDYDMAFSDIFSQIINI